MAHFSWHLSYQDQVEYEVHGDTEVRKVEKYGGSPHCLAYIKSWYNGTDDEYRREILARQGGISITVPMQGRWLQADYRAFIAYWLESHQKDCASIAKLREKYPDAVEFFPEPVLEPCPRPIYWSQEAKTWLTEPFYEKGASS